MNNSEITKFLKTQKVIAEAYSAAIESAAKRSGITKQEADILIFFFNNPEYSLAADAVKMRGFSKAYASKAIEQLLENGLIEVACDDEDRRMQRIKITGRGGIIAKSVSMAQQKFYERMVSDVTPEERFILNNIFDKIYKTLSDDKENN
ncbi:MAG: MarR family winged helix-turn-helix transcriptional regulator [Acutalibacteraceae bacterium]